MAAIFVAGAQIGTTDERAARIEARLRSMKPGDVIFIEEPGVFARVPYDSAVAVVFNSADPLMRDNLPS